MRGSVVKRGGTWACIYDEAPAGGRRRQRWHSGFRRKHEAEAFLREQLAQLDAGAYVAPARLTVADFARDWLPAASRRLRPLTIERYAGVLRNQILPVLGELRLQALGPARVTAFYGELEASGLSQSSVRVAAMVLRRLLRDAERMGYISRSPADRVDSPPRGRSRAGAWTPGEVSKFLESVRGDPLFPFLRLASTSGCRRGELLAITWRTLDLGNGALTIERQLIATRTVPAFGPTKSSRSRRTIMLDAETVEELERHRAVQLAERSFAGGAYRDLDLVFANPLGKPLHPHWVTRRFGELRVRAGAAAGHAAHASALGRDRDAELRRSRARRCCQAGR